MEKFKEISNKSPIIDKIVLVITSCLSANREIEWDLLVIQYHPRIQMSFKSI